MMMIGGVVMPLHDTLQKVDETLRTPTGHGDPQASDALNLFRHQSALVEPISGKFELGPVRESQRDSSAGRGDSMQHQVRPQRKRAPALVRN
jgi:hypothetical protein